MRPGVGRVNGIFARNSFCFRRNYDAGVLGEITKLYCCPKSCLSYIKYATFLVDTGTLR